MANLTSAWDKGGVFGWYRTIGSEEPAAGQLVGTYTERVQRVDGRAIYPGGDSWSVRIGDVAQHDTELRDQVHDAMRALAAAQPGFDAEVWDAQWQADLACAVFVRTPVVDDPDILQTGWKLRLEEKFDELHHKGRTFEIEPSLTDLEQPVPGLNLGTVVLQPGPPSTAVVAYPRGVPLGVAGLDADGDVVDADGVKVLPGGGAELTVGTVTTGAAGSSASATIVDGVLSLTLPRGASGAAGSPGAPGTPVELSALGGELRWRYVGDPSWTSLGALADLLGTSDLGADLLAAADAPAALELLGAASADRATHVGQAPLDSVSGLVQALDARMPFFVRSDGAVPSGVTDPALAITVTETGGAVVPDLASTTKRWSGDGVADGALTTATVGSGDTAFTAVAGSGMTCAGGRVVCGRTTTTTYARWGSLALSTGWNLYAVVRIAADPATSASFITFRRAASNMMLGLFTTTADRLEVRDVPSGTLYAQSPVLQYARDYAVAMWGGIGASGNTCHVKVWDLLDPDAAPVWDATFSPTSITEAIASIDFGMQGATAIGPVQFDNIRVGTTNEQPVRVGLDRAPVTRTAVAGLYMPDVNEVIDIAWSGQPTPVITQRRRPDEQPYVGSSFWNTSIGSGAVYGAWDAPNAVNLRSAPNANFNFATFTAPKWRAKASDPFITVRIVDQNGVLTGEVVTLRAPTTRVLSGEVGLPGVNPDSFMIIVDPDGRTIHEFYKFLATGEGTYTARRHLVYDAVTSAGWPVDSTQGIRASRFSLSGGLITVEELRRGATDPYGAILHALSMAMPNELLKNPNADTGSPTPGRRWPALGYDANGATAYSGEVLMGSLWAIPSSVDISALTLASGAPLSNVQRAVAHALQDFGAYASDRSTYVTLYGEIGCDIVLATQVKVALQQVLWHQLVEVTNSSETTVAGGGTRRRPAALEFELTA